MLAFRFSESNVSHKFYNDYDFNHPSVMEQIKSTIC